MVLSVIDPVGSKEKIIEKITPLVDHEVCDVYL